ncbi:MAG: extracellular solute-binding protein [Lachnospiraceae bacterium]|nr:extracellular solute-binding protein [Lachnospiraceae bacterium]
MQQKKKHYIYPRFLVCLLLFFSVSGLMGCGNSNKETGSTGSNISKDENTNNHATAKGRYMETQLSTPDGFEGTGSLVQMSDGSLGIFDYQNGIKYISTDGGNDWSCEEVTALSGIIQSCNDLDGAMAPDGSIFLSYTMWNESTAEKLYPEKYVYLTADGTKQDFELGLEDYKTCLTQEIFSPDGHLFATTDYKVYEIDVWNQSYKLLFETEHMDGLSMCTSGTQLVVLDGTFVYFYDYESGQLNSEDTVLNTFVAEQRVAGSGIALCNAIGEKAGSSLYLASRGGIYHHIIDGSVMEQLADGNLNTLGDPTRTPISLLPLAEDTFLILYQNGELYSYVYDPNASAVPEEQLTIYGLNDNETVRRAISVFRREHPEVFVRFEIGLADENGMTADDAIRNLNTRLLAGEGPDLLLLDGMPIDSYVEKGILADLTSQVAEWKTNNDFFENILQAYQQRNGLFALPIRYEIPIIAGTEMDLKGIRDLNSLAEAVERIADSGQVKWTVLGTYTAETLLEKLYPLCADAWITADNRPDEAALREFLNDARQIYSAEQKNLSEERKQRYARYMDMVYEFYSVQEAQRVQLGMDTQTQDQLLKEQILAAGYLYSMRDYRTLVSVRNEYRNNARDYRFQVWNGQTSNLFVPTGVVGVCANARNPETAEAFLETLLQKEVQKVDLNDGFPINREAFEAFTAQPSIGNDDYSLGMSNEDGELVGLEVKWPNTEEKEELRHLIDSLTTPVQTNQQIKEAILSAGEKALTGEKSIEESVDEIVQKISLQLSE